ncbi:DMT family transporter [Bordetella genomosp. 9]|uniref:DMT family transporter n=1 Tax=Bordetella genomosp. 9 TaxID=1416803 RepID=UPI001E6037E9|nr:DMT family transporter [Bordetella genomosp. 9]
MESRRGAVDGGAWILMAVTVMMWAGSWIAMKMVVPYIGPFDFVVLRYVSGGAVLLAVALAMRRPLAMPSWRTTILVGLTQTAAFQGLVQTALVHGGVAKISLMAYTMPFWVVLFSWMLLGEKPSPRHWAGIAMAGLGLLCVVEPWHRLGDSPSVLLALGSGLCWGLGTVLAKKGFNRHTPDIVAFTGWQMLLGGAAMIPVALAVPQIPTVWNWQLALGMLYIVLAASAAGWLLWLIVVRRVPASVAGLSSLATPVIAALLAWLLFGERPGAVEAFGMILILCGLAIVARATGRPRHATT